MKLAWRHPWNLTPRDARQLQIDARRRVILADDPAAFVLPARIVAADVGYDRPSNLCFASIVGWSVAQGGETGHWTHVQPATFPYVPGLLSFREIPALLPLIRRLPFRPDLVICDGHGHAHPRRFGLASHLGVLLDCLSLGWAKTRLVGTSGDVPPEAGAAAPLMDGNEQIGWVFRSRSGARPTYVSPGHRMSMARALELARALRGPYRLCDPARHAHQLTRLLLAEHRRLSPTGRPDLNQPTA
ncbi:MAG: endonuclease V [bacterium]|nr:endonuclease V [bacterium]